MAYAQGLASVVGSPNLGEWNAQIYSHWVTGLLIGGDSLAQFHAKFWGKSMVDEEQEWLKSYESTAQENRPANKEDIVMDGLGQRTSLRDQSRRRIAHLVKKI